MEHNHIKIRNKTTRFLTASFIGLVLFSSIVFGFLALFMNNRSAQTIHEVGELYMTGMGAELCKHFETTIELRFRQVEGLVEVVQLEDDANAEKLYEELIYRAQVRDFDYLAMCSVDGTFDTLYGESIQALNPEPFLDALNRGEKRVALGYDSSGNEVVLFGVSAEYPMKNGEMSTAVVAAVPKKYISDTLSLEDEESLLYCHILRRDGSFVISNSNTELLEHFGITLSHDGTDSSEKTLADYLEGLASAAEEGTAYSSIISLEEGLRQIYGTPLPFSEWYLIMVMPYSELDEAVNGLSVQRMVVTLAACGAILVLLILIFIRYFALTRQQLQELEEARQTAVEASKAKSEFLSNMSHDIRTPMNAIVGMTAIAVSHIDDREQVYSCLKKIAMSSKHLLGLINDVLDMSKIESGKMTLTMDQVSLREVVEGLVSIVQSQVKAKKQSFDVHIENIVTENVYCDSVRLNQILLNLLSNATKYTPEGGAIELCMIEEESPKGEDYVRIHIRVKDNGIGMSQEFLNKIYDSYSRADGARIHKTEGAGLGMAITKYIVDAMQGKIEIRSELGKGTEFHVILDFEKAQIVEEDMVLPAWNMLVVDDDELLCQTAVDALKSIGINADWTLSGESTIKMITTHHQKREDYQIILLDWKLPGMDGIQVAKEIRQRLGEEIPIILISAYDWSEFETEAREAGISGFISKPLFKSTLFYGLRPFVTGLESSQDDVPEQDSALKGRRILLAEDNDLNWEIASELLSDLGLELEWAENGQICLEKFQASKVGYYDAVLMDIRMPVMTGYEATIAIRGLKRSDASTIPIIAMTADAFSEDIQHCLDCGMNAHVAKPIDIGEIARLLKKHLN